ncbi:hypothetical protein GPECTOR_17g958 [Gonium pectorale]|uniref:Phosphodiesterase n=1 Tax=Gonium pectorale TaxID=33097 RepID=A0A150GKE6_GONPE|nr:hypothetical protein GPECTOR_17g958 [Gonium pectorale]|eukprot:KXZ50319.1 hypothetical protein GPECTOR_17g958 [Gonium pectorale]
MAVDVMSWYRQYIMDSYAPTVSLSVVVHHDPSYDNVVNLFESAAPELLSLAPPNALTSLQLAPNGVIRMAYPLEPNQAVIGHDLIAPDEDKHGALETIAYGRMVLMGPLNFIQGGFGIRAHLPIFIHNVTANATFGGPDALNPLCGSLCYNETTRSKFWGFATALIDLQTLNSGNTSRLRGIGDSGYDYELLAPVWDVSYIGSSAGAATRNYTRLAGSSKRPVEPVIAPMKLGESEWLLYICPREGWVPQWYAPLLSVTVVLAVAVSVLIFAVLLSRRQHQKLLEALLPREMIDHLKHDADPIMGPRIMEAATTADVLLNLLGELLEGGTPDVRDIVLIRQQILQNMDIYRPLNLSSQLRDANLDDDVTKALMHQLGGKFSFSFSSESEEERHGEDIRAGAMLTKSLTMSHHDYATLGADAHDGGPNKTLSSSSHADVVTPLRGGPQADEQHGATRGGLWASSTSRRSITGAALALGAFLAKKPPTPPLPIIEEVEKVLAQADSWQFDAWRLRDVTNGHPLSALGFYLIHRAGLITGLKLKPAVLARLLRHIEAGYNDNPYHNATHAADVLQTLHVILHGAQMHINYVDQLGLLAAYFAAIVHDYGHPGLTNDFLVATLDPLAVRYNDRSPLENHHAAAAFSTMRRAGLDLLSPLSNEQKAAFRKQVIEMVLATDMKQHFSLLSHFNTVHRIANYSNKPAGMTTPDRQGSSMQELQTVAVGMPSIVDLGQAPKPIDETERLLSLQVVIKVADLGHLGEEMEVHKRWLSVLEEEFFRQGDKERQLCLPISPLFDRAKQGVSKSQTGFYEFVALPLVHALCSAFPGARPLMRCFMGNYNHYRAIDGQAAIAEPRSGKLPPAPSSRFAASHLPAAN